MRFRLLASMLAAATVLTLLPATSQAAEDAGAGRAARLERMKAAQHQILMGTAKRREARAKKRLLAWREQQRRLRGEHLKPAPPRPGQPGHHRRHRLERRQSERHPERRAGHPRRHRGSARYQRGYHRDDDHR